MSSSLVLALSLALPMALALLLVRDTRRVWRSLRLVQAGRYGEARAESQRLARSWLALLPSVRSGARYTVALTLHMEGAHERALAALDAIERRSLDRSLTYAVSSLEATLLVLLGRDLDRAAALLEGAGAIARQPEDLVILAHAKHGLGDVAAAEELLAKAGPSRGGGAHQIAIFHTMRGLLLVKLGKSEEALADFRAAADVPLQSWYTERARALLPSADADGDARSSLAPQVMEE